MELVQFMGKDNVPFHTVIFPATLLGTGRPWTLMRSISVTEYLNYEKAQFSKSRGVGVFGNDAKDTNIPVEARRPLLMPNTPANVCWQLFWLLLLQRASRAVKSLMQYLQGYCLPIAYQVCKRMVCVC